eukprot:tig00001542_g9325.t1
MSSKATKPAAADEELDFGKKKKSTKKKDDVEDVAKKVEDLDVDEDDDLGDFGKKKKKAPKKKEEEEEEEEDDKDEDGDDDEVEVGAQAEVDVPLDDRVRFEEGPGGDAPAATIELSEHEKKIRQLPADENADYPYAFLLARMTDFIRANNPELGGEKKRFSIKPPQVVREGTKKTVWLNFPEICAIMHRSPEHVLQFVLAELGTSGSLDASKRLVIKGRLNPKQFENLLRRYIMEFVTCQMCKSFDTNLTRDSVSRLYFLRCESCNSQRSVTGIKSGYVAQIGRRKKVG